MVFGKIYNESIRRFSSWINVTERGIRFLIKNVTERPIRFLRINVTEIGFVDSWKNVTRPERSLGGESQAEVLPRAGLAEPAPLGCGNGLG